jgi:hypothetical protein
MASFPPPAVVSVAGAMAPYGRWWGIAGGWAAELHVGSQTREHDDVEVAILRRDVQAAASTVGGAWWYVKPHPEGREGAGTAHPWDGSPLAAPVHQVLADVGDLRIDFLLNDAVGDEWRYRRDHRIVRSLATTIHDREGLLYLAPELVLLFKAKHRRPKDEHDRRMLVPTLTAEQRSWLRDALATVDPKNPWLAPSAIGM